MEIKELIPIVESMIFVSEEPMTVDFMMMVLGEVGVEKGQVHEVIGELKQKYNENPDTALRLTEIAGGYQFRTKQEYSDWIQKLNVPKPIRLTQPSLETLAIIAYRQPVMRSDIEEIRGVDSGGVIKTLLERGLIRIIGKSDEVGHPLVYGTTKEFMEMFSLNSLKDLPTLKEIEDLDVADRVGLLGKEEGAGSTVSQGIAEVIHEYKDDIIAYAPDMEKEKEDERVVFELEDSVKKLRRLEKDIFPKPKEELQLVERQGIDLVNIDAANDSLIPEPTEPTIDINITGEKDGAAPQDSGSGN